ncbi:hypothetical protein [Agitococcus lubricus]|uniref:Membrane protein required for beta-lactamase induction n=1 Tax=Agitococcus lubricus TaxID=1077255 RepID=A0A2T5J282_9GAMM|nr:hypothetical protein [Agitococcus lubricus]PTQ90629.1 membrane protein required for beta-lactamase induction [Agitococcus lubricus]
MKLLLILLALACRELVTVEWRDILTQPARQWCQRMMTWGLNKQFSANLILLLILAMPVMLVAVALVIANQLDSSWLLYGLLAFTLIPIFSDRELPTVTQLYRQQWLQHDMLADAESSIHHAKQHLLKAYLEELVTPVFWLLILGYMGLLVVLSYYLVRVSRRLASNRWLSERTDHVLWYIDFIPSRAFALTFALAGRFVETWQYVVGQAKNTALSPVAFLVEAASQAEASESQSIAVESMRAVATLAAYESLCYRSMLIWLVLLSLHWIL